jgi:hypothetical protein
VKKTGYGYAEFVSPHFCFFREKERERCKDWRRGKRGFVGEEGVKG